MGSGLRFRTVLWPTDFSPLAQAALPYAVGLAAEHGGELVILHVLPSLASYAGAEMPALAWKQLQDQNAAAEAALRRREAEQAAPHLRITTDLVEGVPVEEILHAARRHRCELIVIATHGRTGLAHVLMGSVAENVVRRAPCPVLTVRPSELTHPQRGEGETR